MVRISSTSICDESDDAREAKTVPLSRNANFFLLYLRNSEYDRK